MSQTIKSGRSQNPKVVQGLDVIDVRDNIIYSMRTLIELLDVVNYGYDSLKEKEKLSIGDLLEIIEYLEEATDTIKNTIKKV